MRRTMSGLSQGSAGLINLSADSVALSIGLGRHFACYLSCLELGIRVFFRVVALGIGRASFVCFVVVRRCDIHIRASAGVAACLFATKLSQSTP